jgi:hypothetical protein
MPATLWLGAQTYEISAAEIGAIRLQKDDGSVYFNFEEIAEPVSVPTGFRFQETTAMNIALNKAMDLLEQKGFGKGHIISSP